MVPILSAAPAVVGAGAGGCRPAWRADRAAVPAVARAGGGGCQALGRAGVGGGRAAGFGDQRWKRRAESGRFWRLTRAPPAAQRWPFGGLHLSFKITARVLILRCTISEFMINYIKIFDAIQESYMPLRDPERQKRNQKIENLTDQLRQQLPIVLEISGFLNEQSLHATFGGKNAQYIDIKNEIIHSPEQFINLWLQGYLRYMENLGEHYKSSSYFENYLLLRQYEALRNYVFLFLERTYWRNFESLSKKRPTVDESMIWIGQEKASYGLLVTPRFKGGNWENDKSEIRHFKKQYWTIGHILQTGLVIPFEDSTVKFRDIDQYLVFFKSVLVRASGSPHEMNVAKRYCDFVRNASNPEEIPLIIPEIRYGGLQRNHEYRLDFCIIDPFSMSKVGFELSPWSTHGELTHLKGVTQVEINRRAQANFEKEMKKSKSFFRKFGIITLIFTDADLIDPDSLFEEFKKFLTPEKAQVQMRLSVLEDFLNFAL